MRVDLEIDQSRFPVRLAIIGRLLATLLLARRRRSGQDGSRIDLEVSWSFRLSSSAPRGGRHVPDGIPRSRKGVVVRSFLKMAVLGLVALASTMSITMVTVEPARAAEPPEASDIAKDPPGEEVDPPSSSADADSEPPPPRPKPSPDEVSTNAVCNDQYCTHPWYDKYGNMIDEGVVSRGGGLYSCNWNHSGKSVGIQVDPTDGKWTYYTVGDATTGEKDGLCAADHVERRGIRKIRFIAVDRAGRVVGTPTPWIAPPGGYGRP